jgi:hypothetical protein
VINRRRVLLPGRCGCGRRSDQPGAYANSSVHLCIVGNHDGRQVRAVHAATADGKAYDFASYIQDTALTPFS